MALFYQPQRMMVPVMPFPHIPRFDYPTGPPYRPTQASEKYYFEKSGGLISDIGPTENSWGLISDIEPTWWDVLEGEFIKHYFFKLCLFVELERRWFPPVYPSQSDVFHWTRACTVSKVKVIILGQDPYPTEGRATGLAFDVHPGKKISKSLSNIFEELKYDGYSPHGYPGDWAEQGVLLLNSVLTVKEGHPNSHAGHGWETLTDAVVNYFNERREGIVFILLGQKAQAKGIRINTNKHFVIPAVHPSPRSANRGFFGSGVFSQCNRFLFNSGQGQIDW